MASFSWFVRDLIAEANKQGLGTAKVEPSALHTELVAKALSSPRRAVILAGMSPESRRELIYEIAKLRTRIMGSNPELAFGVVEVVLWEFHKKREDRQEDIDDFFRYLAKSPQTIVYLDSLDPYLELGSEKGNFNYACTLLSNALRNHSIACIAGLSSDEVLLKLRANPSWRDHFTLLDAGTGTAGEVLEHLLRRSAAISSRHGVVIAPTAIGAAATLTRELMPKSRWLEQSEEILDSACARYKGKIQAKETYPDMLDQASMERLTDKVGPYDVMRVVEEKVGISISKSAQDWMQRLKSTMLEQVAGQERAVSTAVLAAANIRMGVRNPLGPAGCVIIAGPDAPLLSRFAKVFIHALVKSEPAIKAVDFSALDTGAAVQALADNGAFRAIVPPHHGDTLGALRVRKAECADRSAFDLLFSDLTGSNDSNGTPGLSPWFATVVVIQLQIDLAEAADADRMRSTIEQRIGPGIASISGAPILLT